MIRRRELSREQAQAFMRHGEPDPSVLGASRDVAVVLTQDWCGQWAAMDGYLEEMSARHPDRELVVFQLEYNRVDFFQEFLRFKEQALGNAVIPYVRYYRDGRLIGQSNYVSEQQFLAFFPQ